MTDAPSSETLVLSKYKTSKFFNPEIQKRNLTKECITLQLINTVLKFN